MWQLEELGLDLPSSGAWNERLNKIKVVKQNFKFVFLIAKNYIFVSKLQSSISNSFDFLHSMKNKYMAKWYIIMFINNSSRYVDDWLPYEKYFSLSIKHLEALKNFSRDLFFFLFNPSNELTLVSQ